MRLLVEMAKLGDRAPDLKKLVRIDAVPPAPAPKEKQQYWSGG